MSHIIQLKSRIKTVESIQKTTHAMRLTSMSTHARLIKQKSALLLYSQELEQAITNIRNMHAPSNEIPQTCTHYTNTLIIILGSQKGLCGSFNTRLFRYYKEIIAKKYHGSCIVIGKKIIDLFKQNQSPILHQYTNITPANIFGLVRELCQHILGKSQYAHIIVVSNHPQSFFNQKPSVAHITPPCTNLPEFTANPELKGLCDPNPKIVLEYIESMYLQAQLETLFLNSLVAEYSARFLSMDSSTTNAEKLLQGMRRDYNKLRQAAITNELLDLMGGMF